MKEVHVNEVNEEDKLCLWEKLNFCAQFSFHLSTSCKDRSHDSWGRNEYLTVLGLSATSELFFRYTLILCIINEILVQRAVPKSDRPSSWSSSLLHPCMS